MNKDGCVQPEDTAFLCLCETEALRSADEVEQSIVLEFSDISKISQKSTKDLLRQNNTRGNPGNSILSKLWVSMHLVKPPGTIAKNQGISSRDCLPVVL